ncbi:reverse transcriptase domain-containing protein [Tanacetum coccineum]|uniref:Reverse transcriptase domain-containing protein n=1 Tax=Tanacetum coccineum TaxID=301880 RepID=A0ABQ5EDD6_9ASTR
MIPTSIVLIIKESRIDDDDILDALSLDSSVEAKEAARHGFLPPGFSPATRLILQPPSWIGLQILNVLEMKSGFLDFGGGEERRKRKKGNSSARTSLDSRTSNVVMDSNFPSLSGLAAKLRNKDGGNQDASIPAQDVLVHDYLGQVGTNSAQADMSVPHVNESTIPRLFASLVTKEVDSSKKWAPNANLLKEDLNSVPIWVKFHDIPIVSFTINGLSTMATNLGNPIMLDSYTCSMCLQSWRRMDYAHALIDIRDRELMDDMIIVIPNMEDDEVVLHMVRFKPKKPISQAVSKRNNASSSGTKKNSEVPRNVTSSANPFDALNTIKEGDELGSNGRRQVQVDDMVNKNSDSEFVEVYDETASYKAYTSSNVNKASKSGRRGEMKSLYEQWKNNHTEDPYDDDDFDYPGLTDAQMKFAKAFGINLHGQLR